MYPIVSINIKGREKIALSELKYPDYKAFLKVCMTEDVILIANSVDKLLHKLTGRDDLNVIEKLVCMLYLRAICIKSTIELHFTCPESKKDFNSRVKIGDIIEILEKFGNVSTSGSNFVCYVPEKFTTVNGHPVFNIKEREGFNSFDKCRKFYKTALDNFNKADILSFKSPYTKKEVERFDLSLNDQSIILFIALLFGDNLSDLYDFEYQAITKCKLDSAALNNMTFSEILIFVNKFIEEKQNESKDDRKTTIDPYNPISK